MAGDRRGIFCVGQITTATGGIVLKNRQCKFSARLNALCVSFHILSLVSSTAIADTRRIFYGVDKNLHSL